jgi:hypothetical protein
MTLVVAGVAVMLLITFTPMFVAWRRHTARGVRLRAFATAAGWRYRVKDVAVSPVWYRGTPFRTGKDRKATHVLSGRHRDRDVTGFEYSYRSGNSTRRFTVVTLPLPMRGPTLELTRDRPRLVGQDLQLESDEFNAAFRVTADDDRFAYDVLHPRMMDFLLANDRGLPVRFERAELLTWCGGPMAEDRLLGMADHLCDILDRVPAHAWRTP